MAPYSIAYPLMPYWDQLEKMNQDLTKMIPREMAGAVNLMAHPVAGAAAMSALGIGLSMVTNGKSAKCVPASSAELLFAGIPRWRAMFSAISRTATPSSDDPCSTAPAGAFSSPSR